MIEEVFGVDFSEHSAIGFGKFVSRINIERFNILQKRKCIYLSSNTKFNNLDSRDQVIFNNYIFHPSCPEKLKELRPPKHQRRRTTRLNSVIQQHAVEQKRTRTLSFDRTFTVTGASLWNSIPNNVVGVIDTSTDHDDTKKITDFKTRVNKYL